MGEMPPQDAAQLGTNPEYQVLPVPIPGESVQFMLNTSLPPLDDLRVRRALLYGTDRASLVQAVFGPTSPPAYGPLAAVTHGFDPSLKDLYTYDPAQAADLLAQAGWTTRGNDGILERDGQPLTLKGVLMSWGELAKVGTILQAQWRSLGIDLQLETLSYPAALEAGRNGTDHMVPFVFSGTDPDVMSTFFASSNIGSFNWSMVKDPEVDTWLDQAARLTDWSQRAPLYANVQQRVMDQAWVLPVRDQVNLDAASGRVQGLTYDVQGWFPVLYDVWLTGQH